MKFIDTAQIFIKSGSGGKGHISFRHEKYVPKGGPDGGNGGKGGDIIFKSDRSLNTLLDFRYKRHYNAENGDEGGKNRCTGKDGKDIVIRIPTGTLIKNVEEELLADMSEDGSEVIIAKGGKGGKGNAEFATPTRQTPRFSESGGEGQEMEIHLELKIIADVGIIGFPNAGKSTLISKISDAKPKIADYPFTTLTPNLGIVKIDLGKSYVVADIPGLIEGASDGKGLGLQFLRHIERTRVLLYLIDCTDENIKTSFKILRNELKKFNPELLDKKTFVCITKSDIADDEMKKKLSKIKFPKLNIPVLVISSVSGENVDKLKFALFEMLKE